jgi:6-phosphogluconolactonase
MKRFLPLLLLLLSIYATAQKQYYLLVGTYTNGKSEGVYVYDFNTTNGTATMVSKAKTSNPSYLAVAPDQKYVYAVNENHNKGNGGAASAYAFNRKTGELQQLDEVPSGGDDPCYISIDRTGKWAIIANYSSGTISVLPIQQGGKLGAPQTVIHDQGHGTNPARQEGPHAHTSVLSPDNRFLLTTDLGTDKLMLYAFDAKTGKLKPLAPPFLKLPDGTGPRHLAFHPNGKWVYLVQEMGGTVTAFDYSNGKLKEFQTISTLPKDFKGTFTAADIHVSPDGKFLYASTRDQANIITVYKIDPSNGRLTVAGYQSTMGKTPRNFNFDPTGNYLLVANQNSDDIVVFKISHQTGLLTDTGKRIEVGSPVCVKWIGR